MRISLTKLLSLALLCALPAVGLASDDNSKNTTKPSKGPADAV